MTKKLPLSRDARHLIGLIFMPFVLTAAAVTLAFYLLSPDSIFFFKMNYTISQRYSGYSPLTIHWLDTSITFFTALIMVFFTGSMLMGSVLFIGFYLANFVKIYILQEHLMHQDFVLLYELWEGVDRTAHFIMVLVALLLLFVLKSALSKRLVKIRLIVMSSVLALAVYGLKNPEYLLAGWLRERAIGNELDPYATVMFNGPMTAIVIHEMNYQKLVLALKDLDLSSAVLAEFDFRKVPYSLIRKKPNIYILMLESYLDPYYFDKIPYNVPPISGMFAAEINGHETSTFYTIRATAAAEFEVLCGLPNQQSYVSKVFNLLTNKNSSLECLPNFLKRLGYTTIASHPNAASMYNRGNAYPIIGFDKVIFAPDLDMSDKDAVWLNDRSFLQQNLQLVKTQLKTRKPFLNYVMTVGGHFPYELAQQRSAKLDVTKLPKSLAAKALQLSYYTASAVNEYLETLRAIDPDALIVIMGDHFPYVINADDGLLEWQNKQSALPTASYTPKHTLYNLEHQTFGMMLYHSHLVPLRYFEQFDVGNLLVDAMTEGRWCKEHACMQNKPYMLVGSDIIDRSNPAKLYCGDVTLMQQEPLAKQEQCAQAKMLKEVYLLQYQQMLHAFFQ